MKKGISRIPLEMARLKGEDIQDATPKSTQSTIASDEFDFSQQMDERENAYVNNCIPAHEMDKECGMILQGREKSSTLYSKTRNMEVSLDDFVVKKVIGQGSFGKVYMVVHKMTG